MKIVNIFPQEKWDKLKLIEEELVKVICTTIKKLFFMRQGELIECTFNENAEKKPFYEKILKHILIYETDYDVTCLYVNGSVEKYSDWFCPESKLSKNIGWFLPLDYSSEKDSEPLWDPTFIDEDYDLYLGHWSIEWPNEPDELADEYLDFVDIFYHRLALKVESTLKKDSQIKLDRAFEVHFTSHDTGISKKPEHRQTALNYLDSPILKYLQNCSS